MGKKMKLHTETAVSAAVAPWLWPTCVNNPRTLSFRSTANESTYNITTSTYDPPESFFSAAGNDASAATAVVQGLKSNRLFFEPGDRTSSILETAKTDVFPRAKSFEVFAIDSRDPFMDFRASMAEMVAAHCLKDDWDCLEELLAYYLRVNHRSNHGYIVGAFVDLLLHLQNLAAVSAAKVSANPAVDNRGGSSSSTVSSSTRSSVSPCLSSFGS